MKSLFQRLGETPRQTGMLFGAQMGSAGAAFLATAVQVRWMTPVEFGRYAFCISIVVLCGLVMEFGIFPAGGRVLALLHDREEQRRALGALVLMALGDGVVFSAVLAAIAGAVAHFFNVDAKWLLIGAAGIAFLVPLQRVVEDGCQGLNDIRKLSAFQLLMASSQFALFLALAISGKLTAGNALLAYIIGIGLAAVVTIFRLDPIFGSPGKFIREIIAETRRYGFNAYLARITANTSTRLDSLIVTYFLGPAPLGLYYSAQKFSGPIATMSRSLAVTRFRTFARLSSIPARITRWNGIALLFASGSLALAGPFAIRLLFPRYSAAAPLLIPLAVMNLFQGLFQPYNIFLASHGRGAALRNVAIAFTVASVAALFVLVPRFGVIGAAWAVVAAMAVDYLLHLVYYRRLRGDLEPPDQQMPTLGTLLSSQPPNV